MNKFIISSDLTLLDAIIKLDKLSDTALTLFVIDSNDKVIGTITDGDIRRAIVEGTLLSDSLTIAMKVSFTSISIDDTDVVEKLKQCRGKGFDLIPFLDGNGCLVDVCNLKEVKTKLPIDAVLMAGGKGERLRPLTDKIPKPLLRVGDKAIIDYNVDGLISCGIKNISITVNYLKEQLEEHYIKPRGTVQINCVREPKYLGTMGSIKFVDTFYNDTVLVMNSDLFTNIDFEDFYLHFKDNDADMSVATVPYNISVPYGIFELDGRNITGLREKPTYNYHANGGVYLIKKKILELIPDDDFYNATDLIERLIAERMKVIRFPIMGYWIDIGKHEEYNKAKELIKHINI